jgi:hypothetical protein
MKRATFLGFTLLLALSCASQQVPKRTDTANQTPAQTPMPALVADSPPSSDSSERARVEVPPEFKGIDFKNFSYPTNLRGKIRLRDGERIYENQEGGGGDTYHFGSIGFADLTGDARKEAVVQLVQVSCGGSCDGGSHLFYFYSLKKHSPLLFWRIETGSTAYQECGLKSFQLAKRKLALEVFQTCRIRGTKFQPRAESAENDENCPVTKFSAQTFTWFEFEFRNGKVIPSERKALPYPPCDVKNYKAPVTILGD